MNRRCDIALLLAFAYDLKKRRKYRDLVFNKVHLDWVSISASGKYIVFNGQITSPKGDQTQVFDLNGRTIGKPWEDDGRPSHYDLTLDADGQDIAVKLDGSMEVQRIAHMHTKRTDYLTEPHAVPSPDGRFVMWASSWAAESGRPIGAYVAVIDRPEVERKK